MIIKDNEIMEMELLDTVSLSPDTKVQRVPGGWVHTTLIHSGPNTTMSTCFIPIGQCLHDRLIFPNG